jgi:phosphohistidine phosphatase
MERTLVVIRHAKSSWDDPTQSDFDRPLNSRGEHDAPMMGKHLKSRNILPDLVISSPAKRARQTARRIAAAIGYDKEQIAYIEQLYHCEPPVFEDVIAKLGTEHATVFIISHNPGITDFVNSVSHKFRTDNVPTCGVTAIRFSGASWTDFKMEEKKVIMFDYPKNL